MIMYKISFYKYKFFIFFLKYMFTFFFWSKFRRFGIYGLKIRLKGKVGVAGNGRKRSVKFKIGKVATFDLKFKVSYSIMLVNTFTGVLGFQIWLFFI